MPPRSVLKLNPIPKEWGFLLCNIFIDMMNIEEFKTGDVLHCRGKSLLSRIIRWATKSQINHTALFIWIWGEPYIIDAQDNGVNVKPFGEWVKEYNYNFVAMRRPRVIAEKKIATKAMSKVGLTAYDFEGLILKQPIELLTGKWNKKPSNKEQDKMYCSEFVSWVYGLDDSYRMSPKDFLDYCNENEWDTIYNTGIEL